LANSDRTTSRVSSKRACNVCSALQAINSTTHTSRCGDYFDPAATVQCEKNCPGNHSPMASFKP
jgi:hypothetical protein